MARRNGRRRYPEEVRLVRVRPHDERTRKGGKGRLVRLGVFLAVFFLSAACLGKVCSVLIGQCVNAFAPQEEAEPGEEKLPEEMLGGPVGVNPDDVVMLSQEEHGPRIAIDAGHGGEDDGCHRNGVSESEVNLELALLLEEKLQTLGFETVMLREDHESFLSLEERVKKAEDEDADIYVSIHQNACEEDEEEIDGIETWYYTGMQEGRRLAQLVHNGAVGKTGATDRGARETDELYVLKETSMPACLIETSFLSNSRERQAITSPEYQKKLIEGIAQGIDYYFYPKTMYLTFDDGPSEKNTAAVLDILKERGIEATFFVVGENVKKHPEVARRIVREGHTLGIHCYSHDYKEIYKDVDSYLEDFQKAYDLVYEVTGVEVELFRFPGGSINAYNKKVYKDIIQAMTEKGFIYFDWNASLEDATKNTTPQMLVQNGVSSTLGRKTVVMLAHDVVYDTTQCLRELIDSLPEYEMKPLTAEVEPIQF